MMSLASSSSRFGRCGFAALWLVVATLGPGRASAAEPTARPVARPVIRPVIHLVASIAPLAMIAKRLGGDRVEVRALLPVGADPHTFELRPSDATAVADADVVLLLGSSMDEWLSAAMTGSNNAIVVRLDAIAGEDGHDEHAGHGHGEGEHDPHVWLDPTWVRDRAIAPIHRALNAADPEGASHYGVAARAMAEETADLEMKLENKFLSAETRSFLAWHPAWQGFAKRFGLHSVGNVGEASAGEPSLKAVVAAVRVAGAAKVRAILVEPQIDPRLASVLADELRIPLVTVDPLGDLQSLDRSTYELLMIYNGNAFGRALGVLEKREPREPPISAIP